jgi:hypothetical protein
MRPGLSQSLACGESGRKNMLISLIYVSTATHLMSNAELLDILRVSRRKNEEKSVTGMLLYKGGNFMQALEGPEESVKEIFGKIQADSRHRGIILLSSEPIEKRQFADWKIAFVNLDDEAIRQESAYSEFLQDEFTAEKYRQAPQQAYIMLLSFRENLR